MITPCVGLLRSVLASDRGWSSLRGADRGPHCLVANRRVCCEGCQSGCTQRASTQAERRLQRTSLL